MNIALERAMRKHNQIQKKQQEVSKEIDKCANNIYQSLNTMQRNCGEYSSEMHKMLKK